MCFVRHVMSTLNSARMWRAKHASVLLDKEDSIMIPWSWRGFLRVGFWIIALEVLMLVTGLVELDVLTGPPWELLMRPFMMMVLLIVVVREGIMMPSFRRDFLREGIMMPSFRRDGVELVLAFCMYLLIGAISMLFEAPQAPAGVGSILDDKWGILPLWGLSVWLLRDLVVPLWAILWRDIRQPRALN